VHTGKAVCPGSLCSTLFRYFEQEASALPRAGTRKRFGLTRREQQLMPLVAQGLTNKEIASHFSLSEQTVKNHLYRMKHKIGAEDRFEMAHFYHTQSFLL
jgi:DNA-binding NarL/FixJ family response regulator